MSERLRAGSSDSRNVLAAKFDALIKVDVENEISQGCSSRPYDKT